MQFVNWKKFYYLQGSEIEITFFVNALVFSCMQIFPCDVWRKGVCQLTNQIEAHCVSSARFILVMFVVRGR